MPWFLKFGTAGIGTGSLVFGPVSMYTDSFLTSPNAKPSSRHCSRVMLREQLLQRPRAHHRAGEVVPAAGLRLLDHRDRHFAEALHRLRVVAQQLQQAVGAGEAGGAAADDRHAHLDQLVLGVEAVLDELLLGVHRRREGRGHDLAVAGAVMR